MGKFREWQNDNILCNYTQTDNDTICLVVGVCIDKWEVWHIIPINGMKIAILVNAIMIPSM
jgi:hypothetical protein